MLKGQQTQGGSPPSKLSVDDGIKVRKDLLESCEVVLRSMLLIIDSRSKARSRGYGFDSHQDL